MGFDSWDTLNTGDETYNPGPIDNSPLFKGWLFLSHLTNHRLCSGAAKCVFFLHKISLAQNPWPCISPALYQCMTECVLIKLLKALTLSSLSLAQSLSL